MKSYYIKIKILHSTPIHIVSKNIEKINSALIVLFFKYSSNIVIAKISYNIWIAV